jgi:MtN3 and saliva related transmembrane protein
MKGIIFRVSQRIMDNNTITEVIGIAAGTCTAISLLPQLIKLIKEKKAEAISVFYLVILFIGLSLWVWYGFMREDPPIIITNIVSAVINVFVFVLSLKYKKQNSDQV